MLKKKIIALVLSIMLVFTLSACSSTDAVWVNPSFDEKPMSKKLQNNKLIAENDKFELVWVSSNCSVAIIDKETGARFETTPRKAGEATVDEYGMPIKKNPQLESALILKYLNPKTGVEEQALSATSAVSNGRVVATLIDGGVKVDYYFDDIDVMVPVEYLLREDGLSVSIDPKNIQEMEKHVISISILPFLCSAENDVDDSYLFIPSGSGALVKNQTISQAGVVYTTPLYGTDLGSVITDISTVEEAAKLPVYGVKNGNTGMCAIIEEGDSHAAFTANVGSTNIKYSGVCATYILRGHSRNTVQLIESRKTRNIYCESMAEDVMTVSFYPLMGEKANYSGMAEIYKNKLIENGKLKAAEEDSSLSLTFVGGAMISKSFLGIPYEDLLPATTLTEVKEILSDVREKTDLKINAKLYGFGVTGVDDSKYAGGLKLNKNLGNKKELAELNDYCKAHNIDLYFDFDLMTLKESSMGYSTFFDVAYNSLSKPADGYKYEAATRGKIDETKHQFLKRELLLDGARQMLSKTSDWSLTGISLGTLTSKVYSDYSSKESVKYYTKGSIDTDVTEIMNEVKKTRKVASYNANAYAALASDVIYGAPLRSSGERIFLTDVPFYQMVFKGYVPMSGEYMNNASDERDSLLRTVESGCGLGYIVIKNYHNEFIENHGYEFYGSRYEDISEGMVTLLSELNLEDYYEAVNGQEIVSNSILDNGLRETVFENGTKVYVNYTDKALASPLGEVEAESFAWEK